MDANVSSCHSCPSWLPSNPWWVYIIVDAAVYLSMWGLLTLAYVVWWCWRKGRLGHTTHPSHTRVTRYVVNLKRTITSVFAQAQVVIGFEVLYTTLNLMYLCLYVVRSYFGVTVQLSVLLSCYLAVEAFLCILFVFPLVMRLLRSDNILMALLYPTTIADALTIFHPFVSLAIGCDWLGLRAVRFGIIVRMRYIFMHLRIVRTFMSGAIVQFLLRLVGMLLAAAGIIHLLEASGDPWDTYSGGGSCAVVERVALKWPDYVYFGVTTLTTVGYGDITPKTTLGRMCVVLFMLGGLSLLGLALGPIKDLVLSDGSYFARYFPDLRKKHIVVCGSLSGRRMARLLQDLFHPDRVPMLYRPDVVFLSEQHPTADIKTVIQSFFPHARFRVGTLLKKKDLQRAQLREAGACIILADMTTTEEESADGSAVMRYIAVKNFTKQVRIIMQVLKSETSAQLHSLPCWNRAQDSVVCISEWRLGWLASACYCPGLSTILGNLLYPTSHSGKKHSSEDMALYSKGANLKIHSIQLPLSLAGQSTKDVLLVCQQLGLMVIAAEVEDQIHINPTRLPSLDSASALYALARDKGTLHALCTLTETRVQAILHDFESTVWLEETGSETLASKGDLLVSLEPSLAATAAVDLAELKNHHVLCLLTNKSSPTLDLRSFTSLLLHHHSGVHLVVVAKDTYIQKLMDAGHTVNQHNSAVHFVIGSPLDVATLQQARVAHCKSCAIFTVNPNPDIEEPALWDKDAILCLRVLEGISHDNGSPIPVVVELLEESNVQFVSLEDEEEEEEELHLSWPYALGQVTTMGMLDALLSASYFDTAGTTIAEAILKSVCITVEPASALPHHMTTFGDAFSYYLTKGRLCVAVKRLRGNSTFPRYFPILAPQSNLVMDRVSDLLIVLA